MFVDCCFYLLNTRIQTNWSLYTNIYRVFKIEGEIMFSMGIWKLIFTSIKTCLFISCFTNLFKMSKAWLSILIWNYNFIQDRWQMLLPQSALRCLNRNWKFESLDLIQILYSLLTFRCVVLLAVYTCTQLWMGHRWYMACPMSRVTRLKKTDNTVVSISLVITNWTLPPVFATPR